MLVKELEKIRLRFLISCFELDLADKTWFPHF